MFLLIVGCDTMFYWTHRLLHVPPLYAWFHKQHHEYKASTVWASEYFGIVDMVRACVLARVRGSVAACVDRLCVVRTLVVCARACFVHRSTDSKLKIG